MTTMARHPWNSEFDWQRPGTEPRHLTPHQVDGFHRNGWLVVERLIDPATVGELMADLDAIAEETAEFVRSQPDSRFLLSETGAVTFAAHLVPRSDAARRISRSRPIGAASPRRSTYRCQACWSPGRVCGGRISGKSTNAAS